MNDSTEALKSYLEEAYQRKLTDAELLNYRDSLLDFFSLLIEIDQSNKRKDNEK